MDFLKQLFIFFIERKKFFLIPVFIILLIFGLLIVLTQGTAVAPFVYTVF